MHTPDSPGSRKTEHVHKHKDPAARWRDEAPKPADYVPPPTTDIDEMIAGRKTPEEVARDIVDRAYGPLKQFCFLPEGFAQKELAHEYRSLEGLSPEEVSDQLDDLNQNPPAAIINPKPPQLEAIELLEMYLAGDYRVCENADPFQPRFGVNLMGKPGCGKTHLMSAFARRMKEFHDGKLQGYLAMVTETVQREFAAYKRTIAKRADPEERQTVYRIDMPEDAGGLDALKAGAGPASLRARMQGMGKTVEERHPETVFREKMRHFQEALAKMRYQPPDFLYLDFESLWELCRTDNEKRDQAFDAILRAKVLFLDDVHPKGDIERVQIVLHVIEGRYAAGRMGTFITTNLTTEELAGQGDGHIVDRLQSRCNEMFYEIDFQDCVDWRTEIRRHRIASLQTFLRGKIARELAQPEEESAPEESATDDSPQPPDTPDTPEDGQPA